jgi:hypothetical protein
VYCAREHSADIRQMTALSRLRLRSWQDFDKDVVGLDRLKEKGGPKAPLVRGKGELSQRLHTIGAREGERIARIRNRGAAIGTRNDVLSCARSLSGHGIGPPVQPNKASSTDERLLDLRATVAATTVQSLARESLLASLARR